MPIKQPDHLYQVLDLIAKAEMQDDVWWHQTGGDKAPEILVNCNDFFWWAFADCEPITPDNIQHLKTAIDECAALPDYAGTGWEGLLFVAKTRGMRPQGACYPKNPDLIKLFDACGPRREVGFGNPRPHPLDN